MPLSSVNPTPVAADLAGYCQAMAQRAQIAGRSLAQTSGQQRNDALHAVADQLRKQIKTIVDANARDLAVARDMGLTEAMIDRLRLNDAGVAKIADAVEQIARQPDPLGGVIEGRVLPNDISLQKVRTPMGVVLIIYESRPNVTSDAAALCIKSGNAVILRGGKEAMHSNAALAQCVRDGLTTAKLPADCVQLVETTDRQAIGHLLKLEDLIDLAIPRGGESLIRAVVEQAHIPVIKHYTGNCHVYVDADCDNQMATDICLNAKTQRPGVCNACETILFHRDALERGLLADICRQLAHHGVSIRGDARTCAAFNQAQPATEEDWATEYLDLVIAVRVVDSLEGAVEHINHYSSKHTDAIVTNHVAAADRFVLCIDSANVFVNCSTRFSDGGQYGLGAEIGISTDKLHARGPMGASDLTTYKWVARGRGQIRS